MPFEFQHNSSNVVQHSDSHPEKRAGHVRIPKSWGIPREQWKSLASGTWPLSHNSGPLSLAPPIPSRPSLYKLSSKQSVVPWMWTHHCTFTVLWLCKDCSHWLECISSPTPTTRPTWYALQILLTLQNSTLTSSSLSSLLHFFLTQTDWVNASLCYPAPWIRLNLFTSPTLL